MENEKNTVKCYIPWYQKRTVILWYQERKIVFADKSKMKGTNTVGKLVMVHCVHWVSIEEIKFHTSLSTQMVDFKHPNDWFATF